MEENKLTPEDREALLVEYQVCQRESDGSARNYWTLLSIFIPFSTAFLSAILYIIAKDSVDETFLIGALIISIFGLGIFFNLEAWLNRVNHFITINNLRMVEIEKKLGVMKRTRIIRGLDHWDKIDINEKAIILATLNDEKEDEVKKSLSEDSEIPEDKRPPETGGKILPKFLYTVIALWSAFTLYVFVLLIYEAFTFD